jgi:hypothetical protein
VIPPKRQNKKIERKIKDPFIRDSEYDNSNENSAKKMKRRKEQVEKEKSVEDMGIASMFKMSEGIFSYKTPGIQK